MQQRKGADGEKERRNRELSEERNLTGTGRKEVEVWEVDQHREPVRETDERWLWGGNCQKGKQGFVQNSKWLEKTS